MEPRTSGAAGHHFAFATALKGCMGGRLYIAPQLRGHVPSHVIRELARQGYRIHRVGAAAYVHGQGHHLILGVWERRTPPPAWAGRLGSVSDGYVRRAERQSVEHRARAFLRDELGRFVARLPWYRVPPPRVYSFEPARLGWADEERLAAERHNRAVRIRRGLVAPESDPVVADRARDGDGDHRDRQGKEVEGDAGGIFPGDDQCRTEPLAGPGRGRGARAGRPLPR